MVDETIWFACTACGRCCNSPPRLSLPELFRFQDVFIGCLAASWLGAQGDAARAILLDRVAMRMRGPGGATHLALMPQGYGFDSMARCPALSGEGACTLQAAGKPAQCEAVPLDPLAADDRQNAVLCERMTDPVFLEAKCLSDTIRTDAARLTHKGRVVDPAAACSLDRRRRAMEDDTSVWGRDVLAHIGLHIAALPPAGGFLALPLSPALLLLAGFSATCRDRVRSFTAAQTALIEHHVQRARERRRAEDLSTTRRLQSWLQEYANLGRILAEPPQQWAPAALARQREAWLGCT